MLLARVAWLAPKLTAVRGGSALREGRKLIHSDSTEYSRPIFERHGLTKVTETMPYEWRK